MGSFTGTLKPVRDQVNHDECVAGKQMNRVASVTELYVHIKECKDQRRYREAIR